MLPVCRAKDGGHTRRRTRDGLPRCTGLRLPADELTGPYAVHAYIYICNPGHRVSRPRGTGSVGDSVGEGVCGQRWPQIWTA